MVVPDAHLLFSGDYKRSGVDLVLSKDGHEYVVPDYFKGPVRATLASPDGANLSGGLVTALTGEVQVAQLGGATAAAQVIGTVTRLTGSATAIRNGVSIQLNMGDKVNKGDVVQAGADSTLGLTFIDGTVFGLSANARMVLNEMVYDPNGSSNSSLLSLVQGTITFVAGETAKHGDMRVDTPVATMGIRGTAVLVEIGFEVPGQGGAPPVKFHVLVEPGGQVGSYVLYSKADPTVVIGTVNAAGQVTSVTGTGDTLTAQAPPFTPEALAIIAPIFQLYFPNVPNPNPRGTGPGGGSPPPGTVPGGTDPQPLNFNPFQDLIPEVPRIIPINVPNAPPGTPPVIVTVTRPNTPPTIEAAHLAVSQGGTVVLGTAHIGVIDPDSTSFTFTVSGVTHGRFEISVDGINWVQATTFTSADLGAGHVRFVHDGSGSPPTFSIQADDGAAANNQGNVQAGTVEFAAVNHAPVLTHASFTLSEGGTVVLSAASIGVSDSDSSAFTFTVSGVTHGTFETSVDGIHWVAATSFTSAQLNAGHVRFAHDGSESAPTFSIQADDGAATDHLSAVLPGSVAFGNVNDAPVLTQASIAVVEGGTVVLSAASIGITDSDSSTFTFTVSGVTHGTFETSVDGIHWVAVTSFTSAQLDAGHVRFAHDGSETAPTFSIQADDGAATDHLSAVLPGSVAFGNVNDAPVLTQASITVSEGGTVVLSAASIGVSDSDSAAFTYTVSGVTHGAFQTSADGVHWSDATSFTTAQLNAGQVRFAHDGGEDAPSFSIQADDGASADHLSGVLAGGVSFTNVNDAPTIGAAATTATIDVPIGGSAGGGLSEGAAEIAARPGLISGIGTASGYGTLALPAGDDNSSGAIDITSVFGPEGINFYGTNYTSLYINNNGNLTFSAPSGDYTPSSIDAGLNNPIIAAFWADVDTNGTGHVYYTLDPVDGVMTITWDQVGYYSAHSDLTNSFQIVLLNQGGGNFDIQYRYADIQWTTGDASGGSGGFGGAPARAGYSAGDGVHYYELPQSGNQSALLDLPETTGPTGVAFEVNDGEVGPSTLTATGSIDFSDPDLGDTHTASAAAAEGTIGTLTLTRLQDTTGTGVGGQFAWTYNANSADVRDVLRDAPEHTLTETFLVTIDDGHGGTITQTVTVTLNGTGEVEEPPVGHDDNLIVSAGAFEGEGYNVLSIENAVLLANDTQAGGETFYIDGYASQPAHGSVSTTHVGTTDYTFDTNQLTPGGTDSFTYIASNGIATSNATTVNISIVALEEGKTTLSGTSGNDILIGGGATSENFVFAPGMGHDTVVNFDNVFHNVHDTIELDHFASVPVGANGEFTETEFAAWLQSGDLVQSGSDTLIHLGDDTLVLRNVALANLHASDFIVHGGPLV